MCKYFQLHASFSLLSFFLPSFMLLNVHRRYMGGGWGGVEYLCPLPVNVKNFTTACRSLFILCPLPLHDCMQIAILLCPLPMSRTSRLHVRSLFILCPVPVNVKNFTTAHRSLFILCPLPVSRTSRLHADHYLSCVLCQCQELHDCMQITIYPVSFANVKNFTTACRSLSILCPLPVNVKNVTTACRSLFILCPLPMSRTSRLLTDHYLSCVLCQSVSRTLFSVLEAPLYPCGN